jgi:coenzyme F420-0:L-glutamate ligase/coenzyme F420-1:gamma-L-glutamate ligase
MNKASQTFWEIVSTRRSIRVFEDRPVPQEIIDKLLQTAVLAPSAHNAQHWRFVVITRGEDKLRFAERMGVDHRAALLAGGMSEADVESRAKGREERISSAPVIVLLCLNTEDVRNFNDATRNDGDYLMGVQSVALAGGHLLLAAHAEGLGAVWVCAPLFAPERVREALDLPENWIPQGMISLGYPAEEPKNKEMKPMEKVVHFI